MDGHPCCGRPRCFTSPLTEISEKLPEKPPPLVAPHPDLDDPLMELPADAVTYQYDGLEPASSYTWKVLATDSEGGQTESAIGTFTTQ